MPSIISPGIGSGLDVNSLVLQLVAAEGQPTALRLDRQEAGVQAELSAFGTLRGALEQFRSALENFTDLDTFQGRTVSSSSPENFTASASNTSAPGQFDVEVRQLATAQKLTSDAFVDSTTKVGNGIMTFSAGTGVDAQSFSFAVVDDANSLADIRDAINSHDDNFGVSATIVTGSDGAHLVLTAADTGDSNALTITTSNGDGNLAALEYDPLGGTTNLTQTIAPQDAIATIDGFEVVSESNSITDAIDGVTINLVSAEPGTVSQLQIGFDLAGARSAVTDFVDAYNDVVKTASSLSSYDPETKIGGTLLGDSTLRSVTTALSRELSILPDGLEFGSLAELGITTDFDGTLTIDEEKLDEQFEADFNSVGQLFASEEGFATRLDAALGVFLDSDGQLENRTDGLLSQIDDISGQRDDLDARLISLETRYRQQFTALDSLIAQLTATSDFLSQQLASIPVPGSNGA